jgi:long-subunit acyl-CoA synthetase (AMP-forming)
VNEYFTPAVVRADPDANTTDLLVARVAATPDAPLFALPASDGGWTDVSTAEFHRQVVSLAKGLIQPGEKIGFMCKTRYEWTLVDFATWFAGAVLVPIYETSAPAQLQFNLADSGATALIVESADYFAKFDEVRSELPLVTKVWQLQLGDLDKLVAGGVAVTDATVETRRSAAVGKDLATIIYTSGSTGRPKGCVLTHSNFAEATAESGGKGKIFRAAAKVAVEHSKALDVGKVPLGLELRFRVFDRLVYSKLKKVMGGRIRFAVSGSAPLGLFLGHFFRSLDVKILEGYGLTETTAPATVNLVDKFKIGTVGPALPGVGLKIAEDGEILVKGVDVFDGYWNNPSATGEVMEGEWFKTGDIGALDDDGYLTVTGRKKEIIVTAGGKNVAPAGLEDPIRSNSLIGQVVVVGDQKPFIAALVTLDPEMLPVWLNNNGEAADMSLEKAAENPKVVAEVQKAVDAANARVSRAESIRKFVILPVEFTEASGHLTPKMSIKRGPILKDYAGVIEAMYTGAPATKGESLVH